MISDIIRGSGWEIDMDDDNEGRGLSGFGTFMLLVGIVGLIGFVLVLAGAGGG